MTLGIIYTLVLAGYLVAEKRETFIGRLCLLMNAILWPMILGQSIWEMEHGRKTKARSIDYSTSTIWCDRCNTNTFSYDGGKTCGECGCG